VGRYLVWCPKLVKSDNLVKAKKNLYRSRD
jgi:hypothetical protein